MNDKSHRTEHNSCPVCQSSSLKTKYVINGFTIVQCPSCKLMFVKERLSQPELDECYRKPSEGEEAGEDCVYLNQANVENLNYYYRRLKSFILKQISGGTILDVGCNAGYFLDVMEDFDRYGVERSGSHAEVAKRKYGDKIFSGTFEDFNPPDSFFDCVSLQDVLDHMTDPVAALRKCHRLLKPGGVLIVKVHDMSSFIARITGRNFYAFIPPIHLFYFSRNSLAATLQKASFEVIVSKHIGHTMFLSTIFYRLSKGNPRSFFFWLYKRTVNTGLGRLRLYKNLGDIITVIAVKRPAGPHPGETS